MELFADVLIVLGVVALTPPILLLPVETLNDMGPLSLLAAVAAGLLTTGVLIHRRRERGSV